MVIRLVSAMMICTWALGACTAPTTASEPAPDEDEVQEVVDAVLLKHSIAYVVDVACRDEGIRLREPNTREALEEEVDNLVSQGYSRFQLNRLARSANKDDRLTQKALSELETRGVRRNDRASVCAYARQEIAAGSAVGRLLKTT